MVVLSNRQKLHKLYTNHRQNSSGVGSVVVTWGDKLKDVFIQFRDLIKMLWGGSVLNDVVLSLLFKIVVSLLSE